MLRPVADVMGQFLVETFKRGITAADRDNIASHVESVKKVGDVNVQIETSKKAKNTAEWAAAASDVNEKDNPEAAAAWRAVLEGILKENDYDLLGKVKKMNQMEVRALVDMLDAQSGGREFHDSELGDRLKGLGLARQSYISARVSRILTYLTFFCVLSDIFL